MISRQYPIGAEANCRAYVLKCNVCGALYNDNGFLLNCRIAHEPSLLIAQYASKRFEYDPLAEGIYRYRCWLPAVRKFSGSGTTVTYQSKGLNRITGLRNLWIAFSGYWPERGAYLQTATFKELEAFAVLSRIPRSSHKVIVVASAGNTAAAFSRICSENQMPCLIILPERGVARMRLSEPPGNCVRVVALESSCDYFDAIVLAQRISREEGFFEEGGMKNVARRDGLATAMLNATETIGRLPDYYFQAIGSGTGAIAAHETARRLILDGRFGHVFPRLMLSQNFPFTAMYASWKLRQRQLVKLSRNVAKAQGEEMIAKVLSNFKPGYSVAGGIFDVLIESQGDMLIAGNDEVSLAMALFKKLEEVDLDPAAGVALATLLNTARSGVIDPNKLVLLHLTGGSSRKSESGAPIKPTLTLDASQVSAPEGISRLLQLFDCVN